MCQLYLNISHNYLFGHSDKKFIRIYSDICSCQICFYKYIQTFIYIYIVYYTYMNIIHTVYLNLDSSYLRGVSGGHLVQLQLKSPSSKSKSPSPTQLRLVGLGDLDMDSGDLSGVGQVCRTYTKAEPSNCGVGAHMNSM